MKVCKLQGGLHRPLTSPGASHSQLVSERPRKASPFDRGEDKRGDAVHGLYNVNLEDPLQLCSLMSLKMQMSRVFAKFVCEILWDRHLQQMSWSQAQSASQFLIALSQI